MKTYLQRITHGLFALVAALLLVACGSGDDNTFPSPTGPYKLTFSLDASFQADHGGQPIRIAVVRSSDKAVVAEGGGTVSASQNPSFSFAAGAVMERGTAYEVHYWTDSNISGGTSGVCDLETIDHQWSVEFLSPTNDVNFTVSHQPWLVEYVCDTFIS